MSGVKGSKFNWLPPEKENTAVYKLNNSTATVTYSLQSTCDDCVAHNAINMFCCNGS